MAGAARVGERYFIIFIEQMSIGSWSLSWRPLGAPSDKCLMNNAIKVRVGSLRLTLTLIFIYLTSLTIRNPIPKHKYMDKIIIVMIPV